MRSEVIRRGEKERIKVGRKRRRYDVRNEERREVKSREDYGRKEKKSGEKMMISYDRRKTFYIRPSFDFICSFFS